MLVDKIVESSIPLTALWTNLGLVAKAAPSSHLGTLIRAQDQRLAGVIVLNSTTADREQPVDRESRLLSIAQELHATPLVAPNLRELQDVECSVMDMLVRKDGDKILNQINVIRNAVKPAVSDLAKAIAEGLNNITTESVLNVEFVCHDSPESFRDERFVSAVSRYHSSGVEFPIVSVPGVGMLDWEAVLKLTQLGITSVDDASMGFFTLAGKDRLMDLFVNVFVNGTEANLEERRALRTYVDDPQWGVHFTLFAYLLASNLYDNPPEGTNNSLERYNQAIVNIREATGAKIAKLIDIEASNVAAGVLIKTIRSNFVEVYGESFRKFEEMGGSREAVLGMLYADAREYSIDRILENQTHYAELWFRQCATLKASERSRRAVFVYRLAIECLTRALYEHLGTDGTQNQVAQVISRAGEELRAMGEAELQDPVTVALRLVCRSWFTNATAEQFMLDFNQAITETPDLSIQGAEAVATMRYITRYVAGMVNVEFAK